MIVFFSEDRPMAAQIDYWSTTGPSKIVSPRKKDWKNAHNEDEPVAETLATQTGKIDNYSRFDDDRHDEEDGADDEDDSNHDDEDDEGEDDDMDEGEDEDAKMSRCGSVEKEEDGGGAVQNLSLLQCENYSVHTTSEPLKEDHYVGPLETFTITVRGTRLDPLIPASTKARYWALCSSRGAILHSRLHKAAVAPVVSVVKLADSIWAATPDLPISTFDGWIADAKELEAAGLDVAFLRERIEQLRAFVSGKQGQPLIDQHEVRRRHGAITRELRHMEVQIGRLMKKKEELAMLKQEVAALLPDLWPRAEACLDAFAELVAAPW